MLYSTQVALNERGFTTKRWDKWRLSTKRLAPLNSFKEHNLVCEWLETHPNDAENYLNRKSGFNYLDILAKAELATPPTAGLPATATK